MSTATETAPLLNKPQEESEPEGRFDVYVLGIPAGLMCIMWIGFGVLAACWIEGWGVETAFYVIVQVVTTIGYGDVTVDSQRMKIWTGLYVMGTLILIATYIGELLDRLMTAQTDFVRRRVAISKKQARDTAADDVADFAQTATESPSLAAAFIIFALFVVCGTVFYAIHEACSCSYGVTAIEGCVEEPLSMCYETGGAQKSWGEAFYMSIITLTTVGFGDHSPKTRMGRVFGCFWMLAGVAATANLMGNVGHALLVHKQHKKHIKKVSYPLFAKIDTSNDGQLSRNEFRHFALLRFGLVSAADLTEIDDLFDHMDEDKTGLLTFEEICKACDDPSAANMVRMPAAQVARPEPSSV